MIKEKIIGFIVGIIFYLLSRTYRYQVHLESSDSAIAWKQLRSRKQYPGHNFIFATWHRDDAAIIPHFSWGNPKVLVSGSKDGTILATVLRVFGLQTIRGSSSKGGVVAFKQMLRAVKMGDSICLACDGPRGPAFQTKDGVIKLSQLSKRPITPLTAFPDKAYVFEKSWNQARFPLPFSKIHVMVGKPGNYGRDELNQKLNELTLKYFLKKELTLH